MIVAVIALVVIGLAALLFFRTAPGEHLVDTHRPKPGLFNPANWLIGPVMSGQNMSRSMPLHPGAGFVIDMPRPECQPHYVTADCGSLQGKTRIAMKGRAEGGPFFAKDGTSQASICLYFQRQFDDWMAIESARPKDSDTEGFGWYATSNAVAPLVAGEFEISAAFADKWTAVLYSDTP